MYMCTLSPHVRFVNPLPVSFNPVAIPNQPVGFKPVVIPNQPYGHVWEKGIEGTKIPLYSKF